MLVIILDSCRFDTYEKANTKIIDKAIAPAERALTKCNHTLGSFAHFMLMNDFPTPNPIPREILVKKGKAKKRYFFSDNVHLEKWLLSPTAKAEYFSLYKIFKPHYNATDDIIKYVSMIKPEFLEENHIIYLWFGQTHQPFFLLNKRCPGWMTYGPRFDEYNSGEDVIDPIFFENIRNVQSLIVEEIMSKLWIRFLQYYKGEVLITADHGEACGEISPFDGNHKAGHGTDVHQAQYTVPMVYGRLGK